jgi:hypothetical protein
VYRKTGATMAPKTRTRQAQDKKRKADGDYEVSSVLSSSSSSSSEPQKRRHSKKKAARKKYNANTI